jgi:hypothetical protein
MLSQGLREMGEIDNFISRTCIDEFERQMKEGTGNG